MKKTIATLLFLVSALCQAQTERHLYDIRGNAYQSSPKTMAICFDTYICHGCMHTLAAYCRDFHNSRPEVEIVILMRGVPVIGARRSLCSALRDYYSDEERPTAVFDLNPTTRKQYFQKHKIKHFPALILFSDQHKKELYISERKLFTETDISLSVSEYARKKIEKYFQ